MRRDFFFINAVVLAGVAWMLVQGSEHAVSSVLPPSRGDAALGANLAALEAKVALSPTAADVAALASAYLERDQPGLASAVIEKAPREIRTNTEVSVAWSRALFRRGHPREALAVVRDARDACEASAESCSAWQFAKAERQRAFLEQVVAAGIEDPLAEPEATRAAYERSAREVRLVAMR